MNRAEVLRSEFDKARSGIETIEAAAVAEGRGLTDQEQADSEKLFARCEELRPEIEDVAKRAESLAATADVLKRIQPRVEIAARTEPRVETVSPDEYVRLLVRANDTGDNSELETLNRSVALETTANTPGVVPTPIVGSITKFIDASRPAVSVSNRLPMPQYGSTFLRPRVSQQTKVAIQDDGAATPSSPFEGGTFASRTYNITSDSVSKKTFGGSLQISRQDLDWSQADIMAGVTQSLAEQYAIVTDTDLCFAIEAAAPGSSKTTLSLTATAAQFIAALTTSVQTVYNASKQLPDTLFVAVDRWGYLNGLTDTTGRQMFPTAAPNNALGSGGDNTTFVGNSVMGLRVVVDPNFDANFMAVGVSNYVETYEQTHGILTVDFPSRAVVEVGYYGYWATNVYTQAVNRLAP